MSKGHFVKIATYSIVAKAQILYAPCEISHMHLMEVNNCFVIWPLLTVMLSY